MPPKPTTATNQPARTRQRKTYQDDSTYIPKRRYKSGTTTAHANPTKSTPSMQSLNQIQTLLRPAKSYTEKFTHPHPVLDDMHREIAAMATVWEDKLKRGEEVSGEEIYRKIGEWMVVLGPVVEGVRGRLERKG
ncbi:hypothetical protein BDV96DRAFT_642985 [Lophiotrema nucula]|uniref:Uncharacterized protein n=1 Tax=Lophiotrema nucula TaxID=690887 RepID=A0A6A5ZID3_9PLEO|nr:hypothetical protein BDV96DRAFT_642985 [Lophiotrema nucula]